MLAAGTLRFADAPDARAARDGDGDSKPPRLQVASSPRGKEKEEARSGASTRWRGTEKDSSSAFSHRDVDATPRLRELTTPDAALEPARRADTRVRRAPGDATPTAARGVETAFEDSATATTTPSDSRSDDAPPRATFEEERSRVRHRDAETRDADACDDTRDFASDLSSLREWTRELRAYQRAFAEDGVNDESAARAAGAFLRKHLTRADAAVMGFRHACAADGVAAGLVAADERTVDLLCAGEARVKKRVAEDDAVTLHLTGKHLKKGDRALAQTHGSLFPAAA